MPTEPTPDSSFRAAGTHPAAQRDSLHQALDAQRPGSEYRSLIEAAVENVLATSARGRDRAMTGETLAEAVAVVLASRGVALRVTPRTLKRRCQEAVADLRAAGVLVGSDSQRGYWLLTESESRADALRDSLARLRGLVQTIRHLDRALAERLQGVLDLGGVA